jgi:hypothetical protein
LRARNDTSFPADGHAVVSGATGWRRSDEGDNGVRQQHDKLTEFVDEAPLSVTMALPGLTATRTIARTAGGLDPAVDDVLDSIRRRVCLGTCARRLRRRASAIGYVFSMPARCTAAPAT